MKKIIEKVVECLVAILPFFRKKGTAKEFSELITDQYGFLMVQLEKALKDYFDLSAKVKEMRRPDVYGARLGSVPPPPGIQRHRLPLLHPKKR